MKFYASLMISNIYPLPDTQTEWIEITDSQHTKILDILKNNKNLGVESKVIP